MPKAGRAAGPPAAAAQRVLNALVGNPSAVCMRRNFRKFPKFLGGVCTRMVSWLIMLHRGSVDTSAFLMRGIVPIPSTAEDWLPSGCRRMGVATARKPFEALGAKNGPVHQRRACTVAYERPGGRAVWRRGVHGLTSQPAPNTPNPRPERRSAHLFEKSLPQSDGKHSSQQSSYQMREPQSMKP
ncbi:hypothetical protein HNQ65_000174 [Prosthecobacter vanneervenii]|uniref:Uncharacterized protein n=1 Tax=Prosthecobacter vanneervenii TaxID=48466 RepID=A0A7W8DI66_9BACT|nr:hypothetical protein [Prosthecobacter vanneervenii]